MNGWSVNVEASSINDSFKNCANGKEKVKGKSKTLWWTETKGKMMERLLTRLLKDGED